MRQTNQKNRTNQRKGMVMRTRLTLSELDVKDQGDLIRKNYEVLRGFRGEGGRAYLSLRYLIDKHILSVYLSDFLIQSQINWGRNLVDVQKFDKVFINPKSVPQYVPSHFRYDTVRVIKLRIPPLIPTVEIIDGCIEIF